MTISVCSFLARKLSYLLASVLLLSTAFTQAQGPVTGFTLLNNPSCAAPGHFYYISDVPVAGVDIAAKVNEFRIKTGLSADMAYAAAVGSGAENTCITDKLRNYNQSAYGSELIQGPSPSDAAGFPWGDLHNAWIGYTDAAIEQQWVWSNGECKKFENWNYGEPNNYPVNSASSNGEDFAEILLMKPYSYVQNPNQPTSSTNPVSGTNVDPLGRWNDWFNEKIQFAPNYFGGPTSLKVLIEVGPAECAPPTRGTLGCSHGYWKNAKDAAWGTYAAVRNTAGSFVSTFNITTLTASVRGVLSTLSLQQGLELQAGGYNQVSKQGVAALLNAYRGFYPYTAAEVITAVKQMFNTGTATLPIITVNGTTYGGTFTTPEGLASNLDLLNNLGCPLNNKGVMSSSTSSTSRSSDVAMESLAPAKSFAVSGYPNPSRAGFSVQIDGLSTEKTSVKVTDLSGRVIEQRNNVSANQVLKIGDSYKAGMYYIEVTQGAVKKQLKMVKQ